MIGGISIVCFAASYAVALCLEVSRLFFRVGLRTAIMVGFVAAGILAHSIYLGREAQSGLGGGSPLSSWYHGCLILAWLLAVALLVISLRSQRSPVGLILLPTILTLVAVAQVFPRTSQLSNDTWYRLCSLCHGIALLLGTAGVVAGFIGGLLYLAQSYRLKNKIVHAAGMRLPSLERLQRFSENSLITSCVLLVVGLLSGVLLNLARGNNATMPWTDPVVWPSGVLLIWLMAALTFNAFYRPARQGRKVAYLTFASLVFLGIVLAILVCVPSSHGGGSSEAAKAASVGCVELPYGCARMRLSQGGCCAT